MPSVEEESYYETTIREFEQTDLVQGSPVSIPGADYAFSGDTIQLATYLKTLVVKEAGGAGAAKTEGVDYTVVLRTGVLTRLGGGTLAGDAQAWVSYTCTGNDDIAHRQLANRTKKLKADIDAAITTATALAATVAALDAATTTALGTKVPTSRTVTAGAGMTGGGDLSADRTLDVVAANASITVAADSITVGVLQTDAMHGNRGNGSQHTVADASNNGFMSSTDKIALDALVAAAATVYITTSVTTNQNDFAPTGWNTCNGLLFNNTSANNIDVTGFAAPTGAGTRIHYLQQINTGTVTFKYNSGSSAAGNKIFHAGDATAYDAIDGNTNQSPGAVMVYDNTNSCHRIHGGSALS